MAERGKYHGQRLKARDVLRLYAAGERDFRGVILRGQNFCGADLSGVDFSGADIRSARFVDATLRGVRFCGAQGGLQRRWLVGQLILVIVIAILAGFLQGFSGALIGFYLLRPELPFKAAGIAGLFVVIATPITISYQGFTLKALRTVTITDVIASVVAGVAAGIITGAGTEAGIGIAAITASGAGVFAVALAIVIAVAGIGICVGISVVAAAGLGAIVVSTITSIAISINFFIAVFITISITIISFLLSLYISSRIYKHKSKFENIRIIAAALSSLGGTNFCGSDLNDAYFTNAILKSVNFADSRQQTTTLHHVRWYQATQLDKARLGSSNLQDLNVREILTTLNGNNKDLSNTNFTGTNLAAAQLIGANFKGANLSRAMLNAAQLHQSNLTEAACIGTDFTAAQLTGACLEAWNIDDTTLLSDINCNFVFLKETENNKGIRERLPHNPDKFFAPGDFEKYFKEVMDEVKLLIRYGVDPQAFKIAFQALINNHDISPANVRGFERKGSDVLIRVAVPFDQSKADVARTFDTNYEKALPVSTAQQLLEAERQNKQEIIDFANKSIDRISNVLSNLTIQNTAMTNSNNPSISDGSVYAGGDINLTGSTLNLGKISGQVTNQINQLPDPQNDRPSLKDLLTQLQTAIDQDTELSDDEKAEALSEVSKLAKAGKNPQENKMQSLAQRATNTLKAIAETLTDTSQLATACKTLLPTIIALF